MKLAVLIKHVPETDNLKIDEKKGTVVRKGVESIINPLDLYAIEEALRIKEKHPPASITLVSMGPPDAEKSLREAIAMGCDSAILITGREFSGSDTYATSLVLSRVLKKTGNYDIILCGERATDGDTSQVGPAVASFLDLPVLTYVSRVELSDNEVEVDRIVEEGIETYSASLPVLLTISKAIGVPRLPTLKGKKRAKSASIKYVHFDKSLFSPGETGLEGSPTMVVKLFRPVVKRKSVILKPRNEKEIDESIERLIDFISERVEL